MNMTGSDLSKTQANQLLGIKPRKSSKPTPEQAFASIEAAGLPAVVNPTLRHEGMGARTRAIRALLKTQGIKGVSVRQSTGSMCFWTYVDIPRPPLGERTLSTDVGYIGDRGAYLARERSVREKLQAIILAAFPDLDDRSDAYTDYSDFVFMVGFD